MRSLGEAYARTIIESDIRVDVLFGPAYKGIPIAVSTSMALGMMGSDVSFAFNRKEAKNHGEGGNIVGADIRRKVLILDDVLTSGKALKESIGILKSNGADVVGALVALDRDEIDENKQTARQLLEETEGINITSICSIKDVVTYLEKTRKEDTLQRKSGLSERLLLLSLTRIVFSRGLELSAQLRTNPELFFLRVLT